MSLSHFETLLRNASRASPSPSPPLDGNPESKLLISMPSQYVKLATLNPSATTLRPTSALSKEASDSVPERIEGAIAPHSLVAIPGRLVNVHLPNADIRYISGLYSPRDCEFFIDQLFADKSRSRWDRLGKGRSVVQWSRPAGMRYVFSEVEYIAGAFPDFVEAIRKDVVQILKPIYGHEKTDFNYCVCNMYVNGLAGVNWHTDAEPHLVPGCPIACVSFGSERVFSLGKMPQTVTQDIVPTLNVRLETGSMIVMAGDTQQHYLHAIAKEASVKDVRFSLTFRVNYKSHR